MSKRLAIEWDEESDYEIKDEPTPSPDPITPTKKARKPANSSTSTSPSTPSPKQKQKQKLSPGSSASTKKGVYMEMIFEAGLKAINEKAVQDEVG